MPKVTGLFLFEKKGAEPASVDEARSDPKGGLDRDHHGARPNREILVVDRGILDELGLKPGALREQITVEGFPELDTLEPGTRLAVGNSTMKIMEPCHGCLIIGEYNGADPESFREAIEGHRGMFVQFVESDDGVIRVGDEVKLLS